ncbi:microtubule-associated protein RP/EB family member 3-like [Scaptodrosophila lebanonensis]|uniref:Microtubule-associated protein RP/EB family member 3-like n=1 Tax=Drosophila lebanonensis TaxID=7225 RepID=A0A6J2UDD5_DROLE|nr:microtubule-associated protein RP/EB family member 3-like [Scaptodrosophila lebanonensis]XP_030386491.1 microtubule-associated protein RP/EB family member 3-like [Scaptodrosophila lebanonensis]XP_030386492.1 microtubule-associated protein RP/EB family member 3-like [Scaptodrosophila lebanonensis]
MAPLAELLIAKKLVRWVNRALQAHINHIEELSSGAAYCQLLDLLFVNSVPLNEVRFTSNQIVHFKNNFHILLKAFKALGIPIKIPLHHIVRGDFHENLCFAKRFYKFFREVEKGRGGKLDTKGYNPRLRRNYELISIGTPTIEVCHQGTQTSMELLQIVEEEKAKLEVAAGEIANSKVTMRQERDFYLRKLTQIEKLARGHTTINMASKDVLKILYQTEPGFALPAKATEAETESDPKPNPNPKPPTPSDAANSEQ